MSKFASIAVLIDRFSATDTALRAAMTRRGSMRDRVDLLRRSAALLDEIERYEPRDMAELQRQTFFFLTRAVRPGGFDRAGSDVEVALSLLARVTPTLLTGLPQVEAANDNAALSGADAMVVDIRSAADRVSLIDGTYCYVATSASNAAFYGQEAERMVGRPVAEIIGTQRFAERAQAHFDQCLGGTAQEYYHGLTAGRKARIMRCQMRPVRAPDGARRALVLMRDVTDDLPSILAAPDA